MTGTRASIPATTIRTGTASTRNTGCFGGSFGGDWDLDRDEYPDYFWPGVITKTPSGFSRADYDADDLDSSTHERSRQAKFVKTRELLEPHLTRPTGRPAPGFLFHAERGLSEEQVAFLAGHGIMCPDGETLEHAVLT